MKKQSEGLTLQKFGIQALMASIAISCTNPLELVRFRLQSMPELLEIKKIDKPYLGIFDCTKRIAQEQGYRAFWKSNMTNMIRIIPSEAIIFQIKEYLQVKLNTDRRANSGANYIVNSSIGIFATFMTNMFLYPIDVSRVKLSNQVRKTNQNIFTLLRQTVKVEGFRGLYSGYGLNLVGMAIFRGVYFGLFDTLKYQTTNEYQKFMASYLASVAAIIVGYPSDTARRRIIAVPNKYKGTIDCFRKIYQNEGLKGFFYGYQMVFIQSIAIGGFFFVYDNVFCEQMNEILI